MQRPRNARGLDLLRARLGQLHLRVAEQARLAGEPLARALLRGIGRGHRAGEAHRALSAGAPPAAGLRGREVRALPPMEGAGIDVYRTTKSTDLKYINGANTVTFFGLLLYKEEA